MKIRIYLQCCIGVNAHGGLMEENVSIYCSTVIVCYMQVCQEGFSNC